MMEPSFKQRLAGPGTLMGTLLTTSSAELAEVVAACGFDWVFVDAEHGSMGLSGLPDVLRAAQGRCAALVRIPDHAPASFKQALDSGADGIIVPLVNTREEAARAVAMSKYPPLGQRSVGIARAHGYGQSFADYVRTANDSVALIIQIEHIEAVRNLEEILDVPGIDGVLIGPYDLSGSLGLLGAVEERLVVEAVTTVRERCLARGIPVGLFTLRPEAAAREVQRGYRFIAVATDLVLLAGAARQALTLARGGA